MTTKVSIIVAAEARAEGAQAESASPADQTKLRARPAAAAPPTAEPANKGGRGSRRDQLVRMLSTRSGTELAAISAMFGWLPHTTRAALSGLRKAGYAVITEKRADGKPTRYRIAPQIGTASPDDSVPLTARLRTPEHPSEQDSNLGTPVPDDLMATSTDDGFAPATGAA